MDYSALIRDVPDFPKPGIVFKDITPLLADPDALRASIADLGNGFEGIDKVAGIEARGFIFGAAVAAELGVGFVPIRKAGKLPWETHSVAYTLEYAEQEVELHTDAVDAGERILIVDDLLATGGTAEATASLIDKLGGEIAGYSFVVELTFLSGRARLGSDRVHSLVQY